MQNENARGDFHIKFWIQQRSGCKKNGFPNIHCFGAKLSGFMHVFLPFCYTSAQKNTWHSGNDIYNGPKVSTPYKSDAEGHGLYVLKKKKLPNCNITRESEFQSVHATNIPGINLYCQHCIPYRQAAL